MHHFKTYHVQYNHVAYLLRLIIIIIHWYYINIVIVAEALTHIMKGRSTVGLEPHPLNAHNQPVQLNQRKQSLPNTCTCSHFCVL